MHRVYYDKENFNNAVKLIDDAIGYDIKRNKSLHMSVHPEIWEYIYKHENGRVTPPDETGRSFLVYKKCFFCVEPMLFKTDTNGQKLYGFRWTDNRGLKFLSEDVLLDEYGRSENSCG